MLPFSIISGNQKYINTHVRNQNQHQTRTQNHKVNSPTSREQKNKPKNKPIAQEIIDLEADNE